MQLTTFTDLALRIAMRLAVLDEGESSTTAILSEELRVKTSHAAKVVTALQRLGVVETRRGRKGGLRLSPDARSISVGHLIRELEGTGDVVDCEGTECPLRSGCRLRSALRRAQEAFLVVLDEHTIGDLSAAPTKNLLLRLGEQ